MKKRGAPKGNFPPTGAMNYVKQQTIARSFARRYLGESPASESLIISPATDSVASLDIKLAISGLGCCYSRRNLGLSVIWPKPISGHSNTSVVGNESKQACKSSWLCMERTEVARRFFRLGHNLVCNLPEMTV